MNPRPFLLVVLLGANLAPAADSKPTVAPAAPAATAPRGTTPVRADPAPAASVDAFRLISDRNIFNPNRTGRRDRSTEEPAPRVDTISLVGTMNSEKGLFAFFDGSDAAYRKALRIGETVADFKVTQIAGDGAELERAGKMLSMTVGQQLRRPEGADWTLIGLDLARSEAIAARSAEAARAAESNAPLAIPADASETLKRLMEQRQKQLKQ